MFEEYIKKGTPEQKERAENWQISIGLQDVDHLTVSLYLIELAKKHIEGIITIEEVQEKVLQYHSDYKRNVLLGDNHGCKIR